MSDTLERPDIEQFVPWQRQIAERLALGQAKLLDQLPRGGAPLLKAHPLLARMMPALEIGLGRRHFCVLRCGAKLGVFFRGFVIASDVCDGEGVKLRFLGFNSVGPQTPAQVEMNISQNEARGHKAVDSLSRVIERRLETIANGESQEFRAAQGSGPFHAINIDLCDSIAFRDIGDSKGSGLGVLATLLQLQLATTRPWLLFITTLAQPDLLSARNQAGFMDAITANTAVSAEFKDALAALVSTSADELDAYLGEAWTRQDPDFLRLFCAGLGKWLLRILVGTQPSRSLTLRDCCYYRVGSRGPNMLSLVFRCDTQPQQLVDRDGILLTGPVDRDGSDFSEVELAVSMARKLAESSDLDNLLAQNAALAERMIGKAGRLLAAARFDPGAYEIWAKDELAKFASPVATPALHIV